MPVVPGTDPEARSVIRVFLVDDHEVVRRGLRGVLEEEGDLEIVGEAADGAEALDRLATARPDVAIVDLRLGTGSGVELCRQIRERYDDVAVLILTAHDDEAAAEAALDAGASGYVLKRLRASGLVETVRRTASGETTIDPDIAVRAMELARRRERTRDELDQLTAQERRILELLGGGLTNREIARRMSLAEKTIKNYVSSILAKLGLSSRTQAAVYMTTRGPS